MDIEYEVTMLHANENGKNDVTKRVHGFANKPKEGRGWRKFYEKGKLEKDGFIHPDGSLRFEFKVRKATQQESESE